MDLKRFKESASEVFERYDIAKSAINYLPGKTPVLEVKIKKSDGSMDMDTCALVSQELSKILDELDFGDAAYNLDVCSFGAEQPLESDEEIAGAVNGYIHIDYKNPKDGLDHVEGTLLSFENDQLTVEYMVKGRKKTAVVEKDNIRLIRLAVKL